MKIEKHLQKMLNSILMPTKSRQALRAQVLDWFSKTPINDQKALVTLAHVAGIQIRKLGRGGTRTAYDVLGTGWVIKVNQDSNHDYQSEKEYNTIQALKDEPGLKPFLPELIAYQNDTHTLLFKKYKLFKTGVALDNFFLRTHSSMESLSTAASDAGWVAADMHFTNVGYEKNQLKVIDLGLFRQGRY